MPKYPQINYEKTEKINKTLSDLIEAKLREFIKEDTTDYVEFIKLLTKNEEQGSIKKIINQIDTSVISVTNENIKTIQKFVEIDLPKQYKKLLEELEPKAEPQQKSQLEKID